MPTVTLTHADILAAVYRAHVDSGLSSLEATRLALIAADAVFATAAPRT